MLNARELTDEETKTLTITVSTNNLSAPITINVPLSEIA